MTRRDTIIVAILINAGLLTILFITALTSTRDEYLLEKHAPIVERREEPSLPIERVAEPTLPQLAPSQIAEKVEEAKPDEPIVHALPQLSATPKEEGLSALKKEEVKRAPTPQNKNYGEVTVQKGDSLDKIARKHNTTAKELQTINQLQGSLLRIGQVLKVPMNRAKPVETAPVTKAEAPKSKAEYYVVKVGDNPWTIAMKHRIKVDELLRLNNLDDKKARRIKPGDRLRIR